MSGGGKGGQETTQQQIPEYIEDASKRNLARAEEISQIGYTPYYGPDVAAFTPMQEQSFQNTNSMAGAFGLGAPQSGMGQMSPVVEAGGVRGYSSGPLYDAAVSELEQRRPGQFGAIMNQFLDPFTGAPMEMQGPMPAPAPQQQGVPDYIEEYGTRRMNPFGAAFMDAGRGGR